MYVPESKRQAPSRSPKRPSCPLTRRGRICVFVRRSRAARQGFTLIEVLVVVAIIALLLAILLPSLRAAREQARLLVCQTNAKQIASMTALYQADARGRVPVMLNYHYPNSPNYNQTINGEDTLPARTRLLSIALRGYAQERRKLPPEFDPERHWDSPTISDYEKRLLPDYYACPFIRGKRDGQFFLGWITVDGPNGQSQYRTYELDGHRDSYHAWAWPKTLIRNERPTYATGGGGFDPLHPNDPMEGRPKYTALTWNHLKSVRNPSGYDRGSLKLKNTHRDWTSDTRDRELKSGGLSELTVLYCAQGQRMGLEQQYWNIGSHKRNGMGGTNVVFADSHVEWVKGTLVGWN
jgi:prepilin-type N-terminal cleavage/methylation domain-containing protein/prepilin-type processing-associated H-X9-DG protein